MINPRVITLIYTEERVGTGTDKDPIRLNPQLYTLDGVKVADCDDVENYTNFYPSNIDLGDK